MIQIFFTRRQAVTDIMNMYFDNLYSSKKNREIDVEFRNAVGRWERYKSMAEIENGKKFAKLKEQTYPEILKTHRETWESDKEFKEDIEKNSTVVAEKVTGFRIPILNGNRAKNLGADCININLSKQNPTKQQKISYQERYVDAIGEALRWEEWTKKQMIRQEEDQRTKSNQYAKMQLKGPRPESEAGQKRNLSAATEAKNT